MSGARGDGGGGAGGPGVASLSLRGVTVRFGALEANRDVSLEVEPGTIHAVVGENGAGKSTLMKAAFGLAPLAAGEVWIGGQRVERPSPEAAIARGAGMVHQHFMLVETLTVAENVVLGAEPVRAGGRFDARRAEAEVAEVARRHGLAADPRRRVADLSVGEQQRVEILKALYRGARVLILDEPTAVLAPSEVEELFRVLRALAEAGGAVALVTHKLDEVMAVSSRVTVLRRGREVGSFVTARTGPGELARAMVGRDPAPPPPRASLPPGEPRLELVDVRTARHEGVGLDGVTLAVRAGEILGVAGVEGNGQAALCDAVTGLARVSSGRVRIGGVEATAMRAGARRRQLGVGHVPEDRHRRGLLLELSVADNLLVGREAAYARPGWLDRRRLDADARQVIERFDVRPASPSAPVRALSGGNQQKLVLARELLQEPRLLVAAQPTRGVDVGAIERIHAELLALRARGGAVLLVSADLDELLALADRVVVLYRGRITVEVARAEASREALAPHLTGAHAASATLAGGAA